MFIKFGIISPQDGACSYSSKVTLAYLEEHCCKFLKPYFWPPNNPDLNPCEYAILVTLEVKTRKHNRFHIKTLENLKERILEEWDALPQDVISRTINSVRKPVNMVIKKNGGHIDEYIWMDKLHFDLFQILIYSSERKILDF